MNENDPARDRMNAAERFLRSAREEYAAGRAEDAAVFLRASIRALTQSADRLEAPTGVVSMTRGKEAGHAR